MPYEAQTIILPEDAPQSKILDAINQSTYSHSRVLGLIDAEGYDGQITVQYPALKNSMETIRSIIRHCCQNL